MRGRIYFRHKDSNIEVTLEELTNKVRDNKTNLVVIKKPPKWWKASDDRDLIQVKQPINDIPFSDEWECLVK